jgi:hypothetical protein
MRANWRTLAYKTFLGLIVASLVSFGIYAAINDQVKSAATLLTAGIFTLLLFELSKFKRLQGPGFKMEMWEQEQDRIKELADRLEVLSESSIEQLALFAAKVGLFSSGFSIHEKQRLVKQLEDIAEGIGIPREKITSLLKPLLERLCRDYCWDIDGRVRARFRLNNINHELQQRLESLKETVPEIDPNYMNNMLTLIRDSNLDETEKNSLRDIIERENIPFAIAYNKIHR